MAEFDPYKAGEENRKKRMADMIAPNEYTSRTKSGQSAIDRRARMIELLQSQADAPIERFGYGGIEAVTPPTAYLAKILSGAMAGYQSGKAGREQEALDKYQEQARTQDMGTIREAAAMPGTPLNLRPGTQATDLTQMNEMLPQGAEPFTGSIPARRNTMITPEGSQAMFEMTQADRKAVEDLGMRREESRAEMLTRQLDKQTAADEKQKIADARIAERTLDDERRVAAAALKSQEDVTAAKLLADANAEKAQLAAEQALKPKPLSTKEFNTVKTKLFTIGELKKQINTVKEAFDKIKDSYSVGATYLSGTFDKDAQNYDAALNTMRELKTQLTRTQGMGSQDAKELAIANAALPERTAFKNPDAMAQQINALDSLITGFDRGYQEMADTQNEYYGTPNKQENTANTEANETEIPPARLLKKDGTRTTVNDGEGNISYWKNVNGKAVRDE